MGVFMETANITSDVWRRVLDEAAEGFRVLTGLPTPDDLDAHMERYAPSFALCESPIEALMLAGLMWIGDDLPKRVEDYPAVIGIGEAYILPQRQIGPDRVDLTVAGGYHDGEGGVRIAVECDGHDFHDRTPAQAARDKARDRRLAAAGWTVMRFTGREIVASPSACAWQVRDVFAASRARQDRLVGKA
jgi:very-short-patch-repair endonuclease